MGRLALFAWSDVEKIGIALFRRFPERDPRGTSLNEVRDLVQRLPRFRGPERPSGKGLLEAIKRAWCEEYDEGE